MPSEQHHNGASDSARVRAEALADDIGARAEQIATTTTQYLRRMFARAREEAEDILAEAQSIRRGEHQ